MNEIVIRTAEHVQIFIDKIKTAIIVEQVLLKSIQLLLLNVAHGLLFVTISYRLPCSRGSK